MGKDLPNSVIGGAWFDEYPSFKFGDQTVSTMAILRRRADMQPTVFEPLILHYRTLLGFLKRAKLKYVVGELNPKNWVDFVEKSITWAQQTGNDVGSSVFGLRLPSTEIALDAYPLLGLQELSYEYNWDGASQGRAVFYIADPVMAESTIIALQSAAMGNSQMVQFFIPFLTASPGGSKWIASGDLVSGEVLEVSVSEWPFKFEVKFGNLPGQSETTTEDKQVFAGTARDVLEEMAKLIGVKIIWLPFPAGPTQLETKVHVDLAGRPIRDTLIAYMNLLGLKYRWLRSPGGGVATFLVAWDSHVKSEPIETFFADAPTQEAKDYNNFLQDIVSYAATYSAEMRHYLASTGIYIDGIYNVLIPYNMNPEDAAWLAARYEKSDHGKVMSVIQNLMSRTRLPGGVGNLEFLNTLGKGLAAINDSIFTSHARFNIGMIKDIGQYRFRQPTAEALQQIAEAYPGGVTDVKQVSAEVAARAAKAQRQPDGSYLFQMPGGGSFTAGPKDPVYISFDQSNNVGGARVFPSGATFPGVGNPEMGVPGIYPFEVSFELIPYFGIWPGLPTYIAGFPPLDGGWEFYKVRYDLSPTTQKLTAFLRTSRLPLYIE